MATPDYLNYILNNPGLRESAEAMGYTQQEMIDMGDWHWNAYGQAEFEEGGRLNTPYETQLPGERTALPNANDISNFEASVRRGDPSAMWTARTELEPTWDVGSFSGDDWNFDPDNPYKTGILGNTIDVDTTVGQIYDTGDNLFVQDRYKTGSQANDFLDSWVTGDKWTGPDWGANYWDVLTTAERDAAGDLRATIPRESTGWDTSVDNTAATAGPYTTAGTTTTGGAAGAMDLSAYRPWTQNYWDAYVPEEHRDPVTWGQWADDHKGHIPGGGWRFTPESYKIQQGSMAGQPAPWRFTSGAPQSSNIYANPWTARSMNLTPAQGADWAGFLSSIDTSPTITPGLLSTGKGGPINFGT
jgi:hypothetical protein